MITATVCDRATYKARDLPYGYLNDCVATGTMPTFDDWLDVADAVEKLARIRDAELDNARDAAENAARPNLCTTYWTAQADQHRVRADKAEKLRLRIAGVEVS